MRLKEKNYILHSITPIVEIIAQTFGKNCEVVLHDFSDPQHSIVKIINGHVTGRKVGDPITDFALAAWHKGGFGKNKEYKVINYKTKTKDGKVLRSSSVFIKNNQDKIIGCLCVNYELTEFLMFRRIMEEFCTTVDFGKEKSIKENEENIETFAVGINEIFEKIIHKAIEEVGKPVSLMQKEDKLKVVSIIKERGGFLIKGSIDQLANELNVSRYTIYNYLEESKAKKKKEII